MRLKDDRTVKGVVLGRMEDLETREKAPDQKSLYWKNILKEAHIDWINIGELTKDKNKGKLLSRPGWTTWRRRRTAEEMDIWKNGEKP